MSGAELRADPTDTDWHSGLTRGHIQLHIFLVATRHKIEMSFKPLRAQLAIVDKQGAVQGSKAAADIEN